MNSQGSSIDNAAGAPTIFGRTDYGSEFALTNDLSTSFSIEIPAFVINDLAETDSGEYFPIIKNGNNDADDGTYTNYYTDDALGTQVTQYFNAAAPDKIETIYDYGTTEIEYLSDSGIDVKNHIYQDGSVYKTYFQDDETNILASTNVGADGSTSRYFSDSDSNYYYSTSTAVDGSIYSHFNDGSNASYSQTVNNNNELISSYYYTEDGFFYEKIIKKIGQFPEKMHFKSFEYDQNILTDTSRLWIKAQEKINALNIRNVTILTQDGSEGLKEQAPFDRILLTAATEDVPSVLLNQLKPDGVLVAPVATSEMMKLASDGLK